MRIPYSIVAQTIADDWQSVKTHIKPEQHLFVALIQQGAAQESVGAAPFAMLTWIGVSRFTDNAVLTQPCAAYWIWLKFVIHYRSVIGLRD